MARLLFSVIVLQPPRPPRPASQSLLSHLLDRTADEDDESKVIIFTVCFRAGCVIV